MPKVLQVGKQNYYAGELTCFAIDVNTANALSRGGYTIQKVSEADKRHIALAADAANNKLFAELVGKIVAALPASSGGSIGQAELDAIGLAARKAIVAGG